MLTNGKLYLAAAICAGLVLSAAAAEAKPMSQQSERQIATTSPLLPGSIGGLGGLANLLPAILPVVLILGAGAFILPAIGLLLFGGSGGFGGMFEGFSKKRSNTGMDHPLFSAEKLTELVQTFTKALEEASKDK